MNPNEAMSGYVDCPKCGALDYHHGKIWVCRFCFHEWGPNEKEEPMPKPVFKKETKTVTTYEVPRQLQEATIILNDHSGSIVMSTKLLRSLDPSLGVRGGKRLAESIRDGHVYNNTVTVSE